MREVIERVRGGEGLTVDEMTAVMDRIMRGQAADQETGELLLALRDKGETVEEVAGAARALRRHMTPIRTARSGVIDTCGTGGDGSQTFNISTAAALVAAASGVPVAKHGNRSVTSRSGSADVLAALGVDIEAPPPVVERCLDRLGICFCYAPLLHPAMRHVGPLRRRLGVPTIFNLLGPLCNPASAPYQLLGVGRPTLRPLLAAAIALLGCHRAAVVSGEDGLDEVTLGGATQVTLVTSVHRREVVWRPEAFGLALAPLDPLRVAGPEASARIVRDVLDGQRGSARDIVLLNAAAALWTAEFDDDPAACARRCGEAVDHGDAARLLQDFIRSSRAEPADNCS